MPIVNKKVKLDNDFRIDLLVESFNYMHIAKVLAYLVPTHKVDAFE